MKVLHLSAISSWGGGENHLLTLCVELQKENVKNQVFCVENSLLHRRLKKTAIAHYPVPLSNKMDPRYVWKLVHFCKAQDFDIVHIHDPTALTLAVAADHFYKMPDFILSKKTSFPIRSRKQTLFKYNYPKIRKILCVSEATKNVSIKTISDPDRLMVIYHGTSLDNKSGKAPFSLRQRLNLSPEKIIIGNIANHIEAKNLETLVHTADYLVNQKDQNQFHFVQIGSFSKRTKELLKLTRILGLRDHITFLNYIPDAADFIPQFDLCLLTSENEGIPQVIYESFFHQVPVVSTNVGGISEAIENNVNGLLANAYDYVNLGEKILFLMENPQVIPNFAEASRKKLLRCFTSVQMAKKTLEVYKNVIDGEQHH